MRMAASLRTTLCRLRCAAITRWAVFPRASRLYTTSTGTRNLLEVVENELSLQQKVLEKLPKFSSFDLNVDGSMATLLRTYNGEEVKVQLDVNSAIEVDNEADSFEEDEEEGFEDQEGKEPTSVPTFTVTVKNSSGSSVQFDCSFDECGPYNEGIDLEWDCMRIDSVSVVPSGRTDVESVYSATSSSLTEELYSSLLEYLKERGINEKFSKEILDFYKEFELQCFVKDFLGVLKDFCNSK